MLPAESDPARGIRRWAVRSAPQETRRPSDQKEMADLVRKFLPTESRSCRRNLQDLSPSENGIQEGGGLLRGRIRRQA